MSQRQLLLALAALTALTVVLALLLRRESGPAAAHSATVDSATPTPTATPAVLAPSSDAPQREPIVARNETATVEPLEALEAGDTDIVEDATPGGEVRVEVRVLAPDETTPLSPHPYAGGVVHTLKWDSKTEDTEPLSAPIDIDGIARFQFPGPVHLDWFRSEAQAAAGLAPGFLESHEDLPAGALYRVAIQCTPGARVLGTVTTLDGRALAGVEVAAYIEGDGVRNEWADDWYPGHFTARSDASGAFVFEALPAGSVTVFVRPGEWLQISPDFHGLLSERVSFELAAGETRDVGILKLTPRAAVEVRVVDAAGRAVIGTEVQLTAVRFDDPYLQHVVDWEARWDPDAVRELHGDLAPEQVSEWIEAAHREAGSAPIWCEDVAERRTDGEGRVRVNLVAGLWEVCVKPKLGDDSLEVRRNVRLPGEDVLVQLPLELASVSGELIDAETGKPVQFANLTLSAGDQNVAGQAGRDGRFRIDSVLLRGPYRLTAQHANYFSLKRELAADARELHLSMRPSMRLALRFRDTKGDAVQAGVVHLIPTKLETSGSADPAAAEWAAKLGRVIARWALDWAATATFLELWPGTYDIVLSLPTDTGRRGEWGEVIPELVEAQRWSLRASRDVHSLTVDLTRHPIAPRTAYAIFNASVVDAKTGATVDGAEVEIAHALRTRSFTTEEGRDLGVTLPVGGIRVTVRHPDYDVLELGPLEIGERGLSALWKLERRP
jgi:hypothetical protein